MTWNKDNVGDEVIIEQFKKLAAGKLNIKDNLKLAARTDIQTRNVQFGSNGENNNNAPRKKSKKVFHKKKFTN
jgi:hypothetical protein